MKHWAWYSHPVLGESFDRWDYVETIKHQVLKSHAARQQMMQSKTQKSFLLASVETSWSLETWNDIHETQQ